MEQLTGVVQHYAWGSKDKIAALRGDPPTRAPEAELWFGAHPSAPSRLGDGSTLLDLIAADPLESLGAHIAERFGPDLPFLLTILAADHPLSIQAHPSIDQARAGYDREDAAGIALDAPNRSFRDRNHKPELVMAITPFETLVGFRAVERTARFLRALDAPELAWMIESIGVGGPLALTAALLDPASGGLGEMQVHEAAVVIGERCQTYEGGDFAGEAAAVARVARSWRGDAGVAVAALLNHLALKPGEAAYLDAGTLHCYLGGLAVEIMANSDNVVRGGLTPKHIDVPTLLELLDPEPITPAPVPVDDGTYRTPAPEFALTRLEPRSERAVAGPAIVLAVTDRSTVEDPNGVIELGPTEAVWVGVGERVTVTAGGLAVLATVGAASTLVGG